MLRVVIVEDEKPILDLMRLNLSRNGQLEVVGAYTNSREALNEITKLRPDAVFLDVEMPGMNGIELAGAILARDESVQIIFVTAYQHYAIDAFKVNAVDYLLKPVSELEIERVVNKLLKTQLLLGRKPEQGEVYRIYCLGGFNVYGDSGARPIKWPTAKAEELFAYFLYQKGKSIDKAKLQEMLWPEMDREKAEHNLYNTIYRLRLSLREAGIVNPINNQLGTYRGDFDVYYCDAFEFEDFVINHKTVTSENVAEYERILALYKGSLFGERDYLWQAGWREKLADYYSGIAKEIATGYITRQEYSKAKAKLKILLEFEPLDEQAHELLMHIYFKSGDRVSLAAHYEQMTAFFKAELDLAPSLQTRELFQRLISELS